MLTGIVQVFAGTKQDLSASWKHVPHASKIGLDWIGLVLCIEYWYSNLKESMILKDLIGGLFTFWRACILSLS